MPENDRLNGRLEQIDLDLVEQEATVVADEAQYSAASCWHIDFEYSLIFGTFDAERARSTVDNWVHKADLQPESGR